MSMFAKDKLLLVGTALAFCSIGFIAYAMSLPPESWVTTLFTSVFGSYVMFWGLRRSKRFTQSDTTRLDSDAGGVTER
jgi:hypothetical protein